MVKVIKEVKQMISACKRVRMQNKAINSCKSDKWSDRQRAYLKLKNA